MNPHPGHDGNRTRDRESLSALADGELAPEELPALVRRWSADAELREAWHCQQLIGDAMRSDELAGRGHEARFLAQLRERLAHEPVVLAPTSQAAGSSPAPAALRVRRRRPAWAGGAAVAAGFAAVAAVLVSLQFPAADRADALLSAVPAGLLPSAGNGAPAAVAVDWVRGGPATVGSPRALDPNPMIRDARLDAYLEAHRQLGSGTWLAAPVATQPSDRTAGALR